MRRLLFHHKVALWAFAFGVVAVSLWNAAALPAQRIEADWRKGVLVMAYWRGLERVLPDEVAKADSPLDHNSFSYRDYTVESLYNPNTQKLSAIVKKRGRPVRRLLNQTETSDGQFKVTFRPLLGKSSQQLETVYYTGGAHCCEVYRLYDLYPRFRLIFDSERYLVGDEMDEHAFVDLNHDGAMEITDSSNAFAYFEEAESLSLSYPTVIFQYDRSQRVYLPANPKFWSVVLPDLAGKKGSIDLHKYKNLRDMPKDYDFSTVNSEAFSVFLSEIYTGHFREAWKFYEREGRYFGSKAAILKRLQADGYYRYLYHNR